MLPSLLTSLFELDAATADFLWTGAMCTLLLAAGGVTLAMLPWSDRDIADVDDTFRGLLSSIGASPIGVSPVGVSPVGVSPVGVSPVEGPRPARVSIQRSASRRS